MNEFFLRRGLRKQKERAIYEVGKDIEFIKAFKKDWLDYDETNDRKRLAVLKRKEELTDEEQNEFEKINNNIVISKAVKNEYEKSLELLEQLKQYVQII